MAYMNALFLLLISFGFNACRVFWRQQTLTSIPTEDYSDLDYDDWSDSSTDHPLTNRDTQESGRELLTTTNPLSLCGDWQQIGLKCYKIVDVLTNKSDGKQLCKQLDKSSTLVQIMSSEEQKAIMTLVNEYRRKSVTVWYRSGSLSAINSSMVSNLWLNLYPTDYGKFHWEGGGEAMQYSAWDEESPDFASHTLCVQMNLDTGTWTDVKCNKKNLVVCERTKQLTMESLYSSLRNVYTNLKAHSIDQDRRIQQQEEFVKSLVQDMAELKSRVNATTNEVA